MRKKLEVVSRQREANELCPGRDVLHHLLPSVLKINLDSEQWRQCAALGVTMWKERDLVTLYVENGKQKAFMKTGMSQRYEILGGFI